MAAKKLGVARSSPKGGGGGGGKKNGVAKAAATTAFPAEKASGSGGRSTSLLGSSLPGIVLAVAAALWYRSGGDGGGGPAPPQPSRKLPPARGGFLDGYYTSDRVPDQDGPSTRALLYPNGGIGEPEVASFETDEAFRALGRVYDELGRIVRDRSHFRDGAALYRGPERAGTHFQWPAVRVGYKRPVPGLYGGDGRQIELETLTEPSSDLRTSDPRVFYVHNFLSPAEADEFVRISTAEENPYKMAPSTGGTHKAWNQGGDSARMSTRTSENAFDISTQNARNVKERAFRLLRMGTYQENLADGIQILRYEVGQAYTSHHDYFPPGQSDDFAWDPRTGGSNRFATVFLYLSDVEKGHGGETVFPQSDRLTSDASADLVERLGEPPPPEWQTQYIKEAGLSEGSWEERLTRACYAKFAVPPRRGDAILFYSQRPDGTLDKRSLHGACPVLKGTKWGANLWVWNACRYSQCREDPLHPAAELPYGLKAPFLSGE